MTRFSFVLAVALASVGGPSSADRPDLCDAAQLAKNGLYYSRSGRPADAERIVLNRFTDNLRTDYSLKGIVTDLYSPEGRFFVRSGHRDISGDARSWMFLSGADRQRTVLLRRITQSVELLPAQFVSVYRPDIVKTLCGDGKTQPGTGSDRNFVGAGEFARFHNDERERSRNPFLLERFHFVFADGKYECRRSDNLMDASGTDRTAEVYLGRKVKTRSNFSVLIEQGAISVAQIVLPKPAMASLPQNDDEKARSAKLRISSVEASLHDLPKSPQTCLSFRAPVPTAAVAKGLARFFRLTGQHEKKSLDLARRGEWTPTVSEFHFQMLDDLGQSALIQVQWPRVR